MNRRNLLGTIAAAAAIAAVGIPAIAAPFDLQAAIDALPDGATLYIPPGTHYLRETLTLRGKRGVSLIGHGAEMVIPTGCHAISFEQGSKDCSVTDCTFRSADYEPPLADGEWYQVGYFKVRT